MTILLTLIIIASGALHIPSNQKQFISTSEPEVEEIITDFFVAMRNSDSPAMQSMLTPDATLYTVVVTEEGNSMLRQTDIGAFMSSVSDAPAGSLDEQLTSFTAHVDGSLSTAWMDYSFYYNGEFSHCGVNTMNLIQTGAGWKIFSIVDTRRRDGC